MISAGENASPVDRFCSDWKAANISSRHVVTAYLGPAREDGAMGGTHPVSALRLLTPGAGLSVQVQRSEPEGG
jgi:hypothetical protein